MQMKEKLVTILSVVIFAAAMTFVGTKLNPLRLQSIQGVGTVFEGRYWTAAQHAQGSSSYFKEILESSRTDSEDVKKVPPVRFQIPKLNIDTSIVEVGEDARGVMEMPQDDRYVGWYKYGRSPGQVGNSVIAGHLDNATGPSIFYDLSALDEGDEIYVTNAEGEALVFEVVEKALFENSGFPIDRVYGQNEESYLNLITCTGYFDRNEGVYDQRLVVFTRLVHNYPNEQP